MSTTNITLPEDLHLQIIMLAARDGVTPNQYVATAMAEKVEGAGGTGFEALGRAWCAESVARTLTIIPMP